MPAYRTISLLLLPCLLLLLSQEAWADFSVTIELNSTLTATQGPNALTGTTGPLGDFDYTLLLPERDLHIARKILSFAYNQANPNEIDLTLLYQVSGADTTSLTGSIGYGIQVPEEAALQVTHLWYVNGLPVPDGAAAQVYFDVEPGDLITGAQSSVPPPGFVNGNLIEQVYFNEVSGLQVPSPVPEPAGWILALCGVTLGWWWMRRVL